MTASEVAAIISELLDVDDLTVDDNFFEIGGNSLLALRLIAQLEERSGAQISLLEVIRCPTPAQLASLAVGEATTKTG